MPDIRFNWFWVVGVYSFSVTLQVLMVLEDENLTAKSRHIE